MAERSDLVLRARVVLLRNSLWRVNNALKDLGQSRPNPFDEVRQKVQREAKAARDVPRDELTGPRAADRSQRDQHHHLGDDPRLTRGGGRRGEPGPFDAPERHGEDDP